MLCCSMCNEHPHSGYSGYRLYPECGRAAWVDLDGCALKAVTSASNPGLEPKVEITRQYCSVFDLHSKTEIV